MSSRPETAPTPARRPRRAASDAAMQRVSLIALAVGVVLDAVLIVVAATRDDSPALLGALIGTALTLVIVLPTVAVAYLGPRLNPVTMAATVLGSWAVKMVIVILVLVLVRDLPGVSTRWIGLALLVGAVSAVLVEGLLLARARQPLEVEPAPEVDEGDRDPSGD